VTATCWILRHAKATPDQRGLAGDFDRPLTELGLRQARALGATVAGSPELLEGLVRPEVVLCSPARRTAQTAAAFLDAVGWSVPVEMVDPFYEADVATVLHEFTGHPGVTSALVVGHQPWVGWLREDLLAAPERAERTTTVCSLAVVTQEVADLAALSPGQGHLAALIPKLLR